MTEKSFLTSIFEKKPHVFAVEDKRGKGSSSSATRRTVLTSLLTRDRLDQVLRDLEKKGIGFQWGVDVNAMRFVDGARTSPPAAQAGGLVRQAALWKLVDSSRHTLQVHQPQRFDSRLHRFCFALEQRFGCLVGANAYLTPAGSQGLAPHFDDVEIFVCQTEGSKKWKIYAPPKGWELSNLHSRDLHQAELGAPILEVTLKPGDVLYMPRGTVHQAAAQAGFSTHVTISTFQNWSQLDLASIALREALGTAERALRPSLPLRRSLPLGFLEEEDKQQRAALSQALRLAAKQLDQAGTGSSWAALAADHLAIDFLTSRLPPPASVVAEWGKGPKPQSIHDLLFRRGPPGLYRLVPSTAVNPGVPEPPEESPAVALVHCLKNRRDQHMMGMKRRPRPPIAFPGSWRPVLAKLLSSVTPVPVSALEDAAHGGPAHEEALQLAAILWLEGVIVCKRATPSDVLQHDVAAPARSGKRTALGATENPVKRRRK